MILERLTIQFLAFGTLARARNTIFAKDRFIITFTCKCSFSVQNDNIRYKQIPFSLRFSDMIHALKIFKTNTWLLESSNRHKNIIARRVHISVAQHMVMKTPTDFLLFLTTKKPWFLSVFSGTRDKEINLFFYNSLCPHKKSLPRSRILFANDL